jgi:two-component system, chemotaxis family, sensor kinase CheA
MSRDPALDTFIAESHELLATMEAVLLKCEQGESDDEAVNELFRAAHTIKGSSGLFGLDAIVAFTHVVESTLDRIRTGNSAIGPELAAVLLGCRDHINSLVEAAGDGTVADEGVRTEGAALLQQLNRLSGVTVAHREEAPPASGAPASSREMDATPPAAVRSWHVAVRFTVDVLRNGMDPLSFIRYLASFGSITSLTVVEEDLPELSQFDPESCHLGFEIDFLTEADQARIAGAFDFVREDCTLEITPPRDGAAVPLSAPTGAPPAAAAGGARTATDAKAAEARSIRVDGDKLDRLIDLIGELIIAGAATGSQARAAGLPRLTESALHLARIVEEVRDQALKLRIVQIGGTFSRFQRVVRDVARESGKEINLELAGADTELDKTLVERIADPLTHLVRNAIDHGIERPEVRQSLGKPAAGTVRLNAYHDAGSVIIEVSDDGGGLSRERILKKATQRGLVPEGVELSDSQVYELIFEPGFSTAEQVTNLSGRGVGMDVVKSNVTALRGSVEIDSRQGIGTRVKLRLPLTLAIIDGFQVGVGTSSFVIPLDLVEECVEMESGGEMDSDKPRGHITLHGSVLPLIRLRSMFDIGGAPGRRESVVVVRGGGKRAGIVVDELLGELQAVIKPLSRLFRQLQGIAGSTILGTGKVALILDVPGLVERGQRLSNQSHRIPSAGPAAEASLAN